MTYDLKFKDFDANLIASRHIHGGIGHVFKFDNGYGASVVKHLFSYGGSQNLWELAVIRFDDAGDWRLTYDTEITSDVEGYLTDEMVHDLLERIKNLDNPKNEET